MRDVFGLVFPIWEEPSGCDFPSLKKTGIDTRYDHMYLGRWIRPSIAGVMLCAQTITSAAADKPQATIGAYYFDGWAGHNSLAGDLREPWAKNAPTHLTRSLTEKFAERMPIWGWRDDSLAIMEQQIDLAADHGLAFFSFCWYWHDNQESINRKAIQEDPKHTSMELFLKARNNQRLKFCLMVANTGSFEIKGTENWKQAVDFWLPYLKHPQYFTVGGKPLIIIFDADGGDKAGFLYLQTAARKAGLPGVAIAGYKYHNHCDPLPDLGYTHRTQYGLLAHKGAEAHKFAELADENRHLWGGGSPPQPYIPMITAGWDKRPWEGLWGCPPLWYYPDRTPEQFMKLLRDAMAWMDQHPDQITAERLMLIYAWNEFGEGGYIAPTRGDPNGKYLQALHAVLTADQHHGLN